MLNVNSPWLLLPILGILHPIQHLSVVLTYLSTCLTVVVMTYPTLPHPGETVPPQTSVCGVWGPGDSSPPSVCLSGSDSGPPLLHIAQHQGPQSQSKTITKYVQYLQAMLYHLSSFFMFFVQVSFFKIPNELKRPMKNQIRKKLE